MGVALKSNVPKICSYANNLGFVLDVLSKFIFIYALFTIQNHNKTGKLFSTDTNPAT